MDYDLGDPVERALTVQVDGAPTDPTSITFMLRSPSGSVTTVTPEKMATGSYRVLLQPDAPGTWQYRWVTTGVGAGAETGSFDVLAWAATLLDPSEFRRLLRGHADGTPDEDLRLYLRATDEAVAAEVGALSGVNPVPALWRQAARIIAEHLWDRWQGAAPVPLQSGADESGVFGRGFAIPAAARELLEQWKRGVSTGASPAPAPPALPVTGGPRGAFPAPLAYPDDPGYWGSRTFWPVT